MAITVHTDFPGGAFGTIESIAPGRVQARIYREDARDGINTQATWFYFRLEGLEGQPVDVVLSGMRDVWNGHPSHSLNERDKPFVSDDGRAWRRWTATSFDADQAELTLHLQPDGDALWVAVLEPYGPVELDALAAEVATRPFARVESAGTSVGGREIAFWTVGDDAAPHCVWLLARQHAWETHTSWCLEGAVRWLLGDEAAAFREHCVVKVLPLLDPDGVVRGATRLNAHGDDTNRHWHETDPDNAEQRALRPEIAAAKAVARDWVASGHRIDAYLNFHDTRDDVMEASAGLAGNALLGELHSAMVAARFAGPLRYHDAPGCVQDALYRKLGIVGALVELGTAWDLPTWDHPVTATDRLAFGADLGRALAAVIRR